MEKNKQFGRYKIEKQIGSGATSDVYLAYDTKMERDVALKILKPALVADLASFNRFTKEAQAAGKLFQDHIATVLDMGENEGRYYIAMRYIEGESLDKRIKRSGPLPWKDVKKLAKQIGSAISFAHSQGYLHRDIKPNNILVDKNGNYILTDFGLTYAMLDSGMTSTSGAVLGTPPYIPPEIWNGQESNSLSDQYSFACVIDEAITGTQLFSGNTQEIIAKHLVKQLEIKGYPKEVPENVKFIIQKALSRQSNDRFEDIDAFVNKLIDPSSFNAIAFLRKIRSEEQSLTDKRNLEKIKAKKKRKVLSILLGIPTLILILLGVYRFLIYQSESAFQETDQDMVLLDTIPNTDVIEILETSTMEAPPSAAEISTLTSVPTAISTPTQKLVQNANGIIQYEPFMEPGIQVQQGSGVEITTLDGEQTGLSVNFYYGDGKPIENVYVTVYTQTKDFSGNSITDDSVSDGRTNEAGAIIFEVPAGTYVVSAKFNGYTWGNAIDVNGQTDIQVENGQQTRMVARLSRLQVGFVYADGSMVENKYVQVYKQEEDISGQWVATDSYIDGRTDNSGMCEFDLAAGNYIVQTKFDGYNWGDTIGNSKGEANIPLESGNITRLIMQLGRMVVAVRDASGNPVDNKYVQVLYQENDLNGNPVAGSQVIDGRTKNTGTAEFDLTPGIYTVRIDKTYSYDIVVETGKVTSTDGITIIN